MFNVELFKKELPPVYSTENVPVDEKLLKIHFFSCCTGWDWWACEFDGEDTFFGFVSSFEKKWGYFSLSEFRKNNKGKEFFVIERDLYFKPTLAREILTKV